MPFFCDEVEVLLTCSGETSGVRRGAHARESVERIVSTKHAGDGHESEGIQRVVCFRRGGLSTM